MAAETIGLRAVLDLKQFNAAYSSYISKLGTMNTVTGSTASQLTSQFTNFGASLLKVAALLSGAVVIGAGVAAAALTKMAVSSVKEAAELEQQIANIASTMNMTTKEASFLSEVIIDLGLDPRLRVTTFEAAEAMDLLAKNGIFAGLSMQEMERTARDAGTAVVMLSNATGAEFGQAANIATDAMVLFGMHSGQLVDIVSNIVGVTTNSKFTIMDYEVALRNGGAAAAMAGVSLEHFNAMVAASAEEAGTGMKAGTGILNFMNRLTPNTEKAADAMKELGLMTADGTNRFFDATGELKDMDEIVRILNQSLFGTTKVVSEVSNRTAEQNALLAELTVEYDAAKDTIEDYTTGVSSLLATEDEKNKAISEAQAIIDKLTPTMEELIAVDSTYTESLQKLTAEQRMIAIETIFGNDAMKVAIALAKEGQQVTGDLTRVTRAFGVSQSEAALMIQNGLTEYELLMREMANTDAIENSETRMDTLMGKVEILGGVFEAFRLRFGSQFLDLFSELAEKFTELASDEKIVAFIENLGASIATFVEALINGEAPLESFKQFLTDVGQGDLATRLQEMVTSIQNFVTPIIQFVQQHSDAFIGALKGIGVALLGIMGFTVVAAALSALLSPVSLLIIAAGALGAAWETNFLNIQDVTQNVVNAVTGFLDEIGVIQFIEELSSAFSGGGLQGLADAIPNALSGLGGNISQSIQDWFTGIDWLQIGTDIVNNLFSAMATAGENLGNAINIFSTWLSTINWEEVGSTIADGLVGAVAAAIVYYATQINALYLFFEALITTTDWATLGTSVLNAVVGMFTGLGTRLSEVLSPMFSEAFSSIDDATGVTGFIDGIVEKFETFKNRISPITGTVGVIFSTLGTSLGTAFDSIKESIQPLLPVFEQLKELFATVSEQFGVMKEVGAILIDAVFGPFIQETQNMSVVGEQFMEVLKFIGNILLNVLLGALMVVIGAIVGLVGGISEAISPLIATFTLILEGAIQFSTGVSQVLTGLFTVLKGIFTGDMAVIEEGFLNAWIGIQNIFEGTLQAIIAIVVGGFETIVAFVAGFIGTVAGFFQNLYDTLVGHSIIPDMVNAIIMWIGIMATTVLSSIGTFFLSMVTTFTTKTKEVITLVQTWLTDIVARFMIWRIDVINRLKELWTEFTEIVTTKMSDILIKFVNFILNIKQKFDEFDFGQLGRNIVDGLIGGIMSKLASAKEAALAVANSVKEAWDGFWNSQSPSKLMTQSGKDIMEGVEIGLEQRAMAAMDTISQIGSELFSGFNSSINNVLPNAPVASQAVSNVNSTTNNFNVNNDFLGNPQITDANSLQMTLAGFK